MNRLRVRWLGRVPYAQADVLQRAWHERTSDDRLLLLEHPHVYTLGTNADPGHVLVPPADVGAELVRADRGGDVTYHGPGQLVGYPIVDLPEWRSGARDVVAYVRALERVLVSALERFGIAAATSDGYTGVWIGDEKIAAIGVRVVKGRTRHGFALNVDPDLGMFENIVPCGIQDRGVTSVAALGGPSDMRVVTDTVVEEFSREFGHDQIERTDVVWRHRPSDLADAGVVADPTVDFGRPEWMKVRVRLGSEYRSLKSTMRDLDLHTVCEEAGCPNIYECWEDGTATFMVLGERCTRACGFCLVDTRKPEAPDPSEPARVAEAVARMGLEHAVVTMVARDDLADGGAAHVADVIAAIRARRPSTAVEVLVSDLAGDEQSIAAVTDAAPDVFNHNVESVARLQRAVRPSAGYARSLSVLARSVRAGLTTKSGLVVGMGETADEVRSTLVDLNDVGVEIVTIGQYLRPTPAHLPVDRWWHPDEFAELADFGHALGISHVEAGPLVRSSYHAREASRAGAGSAAVVVGT
ncbi:MAG: lipoyl synthase [Acidimicrobiia bacterium]|nr:lipoyl synthase [Acidimicrobiia bacterium]